MWYKKERKKIIKQHNFILKQITIIIIKKIYKIQTHCQRSQTLCGNLVGQGIGHGYENWEKEFWKTVFSHFKHDKLTRMVWSSTDFKYFS